MNKQEVEEVERLLTEKKLNEWHAEQKAGLLTVLLIGAIILVLFLLFR